LRAYINVSAIDHSGLVAGKDFRATVTCHNRGQTPAHDVAIAAYIGFRNEHATESDFAPIQSDEEPSVLSVGSGEPIRVHPELGIVSQRHFDAFNAGQIGVYVWGLVEYRDIFNKPHKTQFRSKLHKGAFSPCTKGNKAD
jgi:hypothetical protein